MRAPGAENRFGIGENLTHQFPVALFAQTYAGRSVRQTRRVIKRVPERNIGFAVRAKLRPIIRDGRIIIEQTALGQTMNNGRQHAFGARKNREQSRARHRRLRGGISHASGGINDEFATKVSRRLHASFSVLLDHLVEQTLDFLLSAIKVKFHSGSALPLVFSKIRISARPACPIISGSLCFALTTRQPTRFRPRSKSVRPLAAPHANARLCWCR